MEIEINVLDVFGKSVIGFSDSGVQGVYSKLIDVSGLKPGCYFIRIISGENFQVKNFVKTE